MYVGLYSSLFLAIITLLHIVVSLTGNIRKAKATGLPYILSPIHELELWAWITDPILRWHYRKYLLQEQGWPRWARFMIRDWHYEDKFRAHEEYGPVFLVVTPGGLVCYAADPDVAMSIATQRRTFVKPPGRMKLLEPFGPNVVSTDGELWRFHIRVTLPAVGEGVQKLAWEETKRQTDMLCQSWLKTGAADVRKNMYQLSMNIASHVIFNQSVDWQQDRDATDSSGPLYPPGHKMSLVGALSKLTLYLPFIIVFPQWFLRFLPFEGAQVAIQAYAECDQYMDELLKEEKNSFLATSAGEAPRDNLMTALLNSHDSSADGHKSSGDGEAGFTMRDIKGNMFVFLLAGYETTANNLIYSCIVLALYPDIQARAQEDVDAGYMQLQDPDSDDLSYSFQHHKFRYLVAFMYEMLRVFPIALAVTRQLNSDHELQVPGRENVFKAWLPRGSTCVVNVTGSHFSEANWPSPHIIEPKRWLFKDPNAYDPSSPREQEEAVSIPCHRKGTFMTFGEGPRACLGRQLSRVEFVAFFSRLLRKYNLELDHEQGLSGKALERLIRCRGGGAPVSLNIPETVVLRLVPRHLTE